MPSYLCSLTVIKKPDKIKVNPLTKIKNRIIKNLEEQKEMAQCLLNGERYIAYHEKWVTNPDSKLRNLVFKPRNVNPWFSQYGEKYIFEVRYLNKAIDIQPGKTAISINGINEIPSLICLLIKALETGELDHVIEGFKDI